MADDKETIEAAKKWLALLDAGKSGAAWDAGPPHLQVGGDAAEMDRRTSPGAQAVRQLRQRTAEQVRAQPFDARRARTAITRSSNSIPSSPNGKRATEQVIWMLGERRRLARLRLLHPLTANRHAVVRNPQADRSRDRQISCRPEAVGGDVGARARAGRTRLAVDRRRWTPSRATWGCRRSPSTRSRRSTRCTTCSRSGRFKMTHLHQPAVRAAGRRPPRPST